MSITVSRKSFVKLLCAAVVSFSFAANAEELPVQTQKDLEKRIEAYQPATFGFVKDRPILGWKITSDDFNALPKAIRKPLGAVDKTKYSKEYLAENIGSIVALQMGKEKPDFYIIGKPVFEGKYKVVSLDDVQKKNGKLMKRLGNAPKVEKMFKQRNKGMIGALKTVPVEMIKLSDIGYGLEQPVTIKAPWGEQSKPAGKEGFLVFDSSQSQYYMVNQGDGGNPMSYVPAK